MNIGNVTSDNFNLDYNGKEMQKEVYEQLIDQLQQENKRLKTQLSGTTFCYDEEEHRRLKEQQEEFMEFLEQKEEMYDIGANAEMAGAINGILKRYKEIVNGTERK